MLEKILHNKKLRNTAAILTTLLYLAGFSGCGKNPLFTVLNPQKIDVQTNKSTENFSGDTINASVTPLQKNYQYVEAAVKKPGDADFAAYERLPDSNGTFTKSLATSTYGIHQFKFRTVAYNNSAFETLVEVPVYMNEAESDAALEQVINEIGINETTPQKGDITSLSMNEYYDLIEKDVDAVVEIHCRLGAPCETATYAFNVQGSKTDVFNSADKQLINFYGEGYNYIPAVRSKEEIKNRILQEKNANWPEIAGY